METAHGMVMVMGVTGAGKSTFVNLLKPDSVRVAHGLESGSAPPQAVQVKLDKSCRHSVTIVDTPGFDDSKLNNANIFQQITKALATQYKLGIPLKGLIYLHQITEPRMRGSDKQYFQAFEELCRGAQTLENVILLTTKWDLVKRKDGIQREQELVSGCWASMIEKGAQVMRFRHNSPGQAKAMILQLVDSDQNMVLDIQQELIDQGKRASETKTGEWFEGCYDTVMDDEIGQRVHGEVDREKAKFKHKFYGAASAIRIFVTLLNLVLTVVNLAT